MAFDLWGESNSKKRKTIPKALRATVWKFYMQGKPEGICYCCETETISFTNFEMGHNKAVAKGGSNSVDNLRPICRTCNSSMQKQSIESFKKKYFPTEKDKQEKQLKQSLKQSLDTLTIKQLKSLAEKYNIKVKGKIVEDSWDSHTAAPTKSEYVKKLSGIVTAKDLKSLPKEAPITVKKK